MRSCFTSLCFLLASSCTTPDVAPAVDVAAPVAAQPEVVPAEVEHAEVEQTEVVAKAEPVAQSPASPEPSTSTTTAPAAVTPTPWGAPLEVTGKSHGLRFTTTAQVERTSTGLQLALDVTLHNTTRARMPVSLHPPLALVMAVPAPGSAGEGLGLGMRGEGFGSDVCVHGGPVHLPPEGRATVARKLVELDPLPWPAGQAYRVTASSRDCRPDRLTFEVVDVIVSQPATPDGVPTLAAVKTPASK